MVFEMKFPPAKSSPSKRVSKFTIFSRFFGASEKVWQVPLFEPATTATDPFTSREFLWQVVLFAPKKEALFLHFFPFFGSKV